MVGERQQDHTCNPFSRSPPAGPQYQRCLYVVLRTFVLLCFFCCCGAVRQSPELVRHHGREPPKKAESVLEVVIPFRGGGKGRGLVEGGMQGNVDVELMLGEPQLQEDSERETGRKGTFDHRSSKLAAATAVGQLAGATAGKRPFLPTLFLRNPAGLEEAIKYPVNVSGTYKGTWEIQGGNASRRFPDLHKSSGNIIFQLTSTSTTESELHYVQGEVVLRDGSYISDGDLHMKLEGTYVQRYGELRMVLSSNDPESETERGLEKGGKVGPALGPYQLGVREKRRGRRKVGDKMDIYELARDCKIRMTTQVAPLSWKLVNGIHEYEPSSMIGAIESPRGAGDGDCFAPLALNVTAVNLEAYYNKAINYTLMVTFVSFLQVLLLIRQMEYTNTQSGAAKVSLLMVGQQAIMDAYLCLLHLTAGIVVESLFNAFATAAFFKFVIFSIFEMRYLLSIWKARRPANANDGWESMRRELSILYSRFYGFLLGGILIMYRLHRLLKHILLLFYAFWIPQIVSNVMLDARRPLHPHYILGITATRLAIPLYTFGCPKNFMRVEPNLGWCIVLACFMCAQAGVLLLQHYFGAWCFIPKRFRPEKYSYFRRVERAVISGGGEEAGSLDCVICMAPVDSAPHSRQRMVTPCDHVFHASCLEKWMDIKMECPTCRRQLPPL